MDFQKKFGLRLAELRTQRGNLSAREMSLQIGQSENYINMIENGHSLPSMSVFFVICDFLGIEPQVFFDFDNHNPKKCDTTADRLRGLTDEQLDLVLSMIEQIKKK